MNAKMIPIKVLGAFAALIWILLPAAVSGQELTSEQIMNRVNKLVSPETVKARIRMVIVTSSGKRRTFLYDSFSKDRGEKNLIRYIEPSRVKGEAILMLNNAEDIWIYFPRTKRVRKLATHTKRQKWEGSDFSYEDMGTGETFLKDFNSKKLGSEKKEGYDCYKIELNRKRGSDVGYSRLILWVIKENFFPVVINYYDRNDPGTLEKVLVQSNIKEIDGIPTGMKMVMYNKQDNTETSMEILDVKYNVKLDDGLFTERGLRK